MAVLARGSKPFRFSNTMLRGIIGSLILIAVAILSLWWSTTNRDHEWSQAVNVIGVTTLTIGSTQIIMDLLVRQSLVGEVLRAVGIRDRVNAVGVTDIDAADRFDWEQVFKGAKSVRAYASEPQHFLQHVWPHILRRGASAPVDITVIYPTDSDARADLRKIAEEEWKARSATLHKHSKIALYKTDIEGTLGYVITDDYLALVLSPVASEIGFNSRVVHLYSANETAEASALFVEPISGFEAAVFRESGAVFADVAGQQSERTDSATPASSADDALKIEELAVPLDKKDQ